MVMRFPRFFLGEALLKIPAETTQDPWHNFGRATLPRRLDMKAAQQRSPTKKDFMGTRRVNFRKQVAHNSRQIYGCFCAS